MNELFRPDNAEAHLDLASTIAFFADGNLRKTSVQGGAVVTLCDANIDRGGSWAEDGTIGF